MRSASSSMYLLSGSSFRPSSNAPSAARQLLRPMYAAPRREWPLAHAASRLMHLFASSSASLNWPSLECAAERLENSTLSLGSSPMASV